MFAKIFRTLSFTAAAAALALIAQPPLLAQIAPSPATRRITEPINENSRLIIKGTVHPLARAANDLGPAPDSMPLDRLQLILRRSDAQESALKHLINDLHTPGSASYHKWLTPTQFGEQFGASDEDIATVEAWLQSHGFSITKVNPGRQSLEISGNVEQFRNTFHTQIHKYRVNGETHYANSTDPQIPAALAPVIGGFAMLNNFHIRSYAKPLGEASYAPTTGKTIPEWTTSGSPYPNFALSPGDYAVQYDLNPLYSAGTNGTGQTIAIVNESNINIYLVDQFRSLFKLPANPPQIIIDGNDPGIDGINNPDGPNGASVEAYLDVEWAGAVAPDATVDLVIGADTALSSGLILALQHAINGNVAPVVSLSFGGCEKNQGSFNQFINALYEQAAAQGITVLVSTGDNGSASCDNDNTQYFAIGGQAVNGLASTPYNIAVGGTDFYYSAWNQGTSAINTQLAGYWNTTSSNNTPTVSIKGVIPEQPWNESQFGLNINSIYNESDGTVTSIAGGSGGASNCATGTYDSSGDTLTCTGGYPKPVWQTGTGVPSDKVRDIPDLSLFASSGINNSYYVICATDGDCQPVSSGGTVQIFGVGGTSASTPSFAGIMALVNQKYGRQGQADFVLYPLAAQYPAAFHDVTNGTNSVPCNVTTTSLGVPPLDCITAGSSVSITDPTYGTATEGQIGTGSTPEYKATAGYDLATGLGTLDANVLVTDWNKVSFASSTVTMSSPTAGTYTHGSSITFTANVAGSSPTGNVALETDNPQSVQQAQGFFALSNGTATGTVTTLPGGTYNVWANYGGDNKNTAGQSAKTLITVSPEASGVFQNVYANGTPLTSGATGIPYGTAFEFFAAVAPTSKLAALETCLAPGSTSACPVFGLPTGTLTFADNGTTFDTAVLNATGEADYNPNDPVARRAATNVGTHSVTASYKGDLSYNASTAGAFTYTVVQATPTLNLSVPNPPVLAGQPTTVTLFVETSGVGAAPTGTISISGAPSGTPTSVSLSSSGVDLETGVTVSYATITIPASAAAGAYTITLAYSGDTNYTSTSITGTVTLSSASSLKPSTTTITTSGAATSPASLTSITVTVTGSGTVAPTGSVILQTSGYDFDPLTLTPISGTDKSEATIQVDSSGILEGANVLTAGYLGDSVYAPSTSAATTLANPLSDFAMVPQTSIVNVPASHTATDTINISSVNGFSGNVALTCSATGGVGCSLSSSSAAIASGGITPVTLTVTTTGVAAGTNYDVLVQGVDSTGHYIHTLGVRVIAASAGFQFIPVTPCRIVDTRWPSGPFGGPEMGTGATRSFDIPQGGCGIPSTAVAYSLNATVVPDGFLSYLTLWPTGEAQPYVSTLNSDGRVKANAAIVPAGTNGGVSVYVSNPTQVILDIDGYFVPAGTTSALAFYPVTPCRVVDTEWPTGPLGGPSISAGGSRSFPVTSSGCGIPSTAQAYSLNITAVPHSTLGYLTAWATGQTQPYVSTLNSSTGTVVANAAIVPASTSGDVSIFVSDAADVILDINGYFAPPGTGGLSLYTVPPCRVIDTRPTAFTGTTVVNVEGSTCAPPSTAQAYVLNATVVPPGSLGYLTLWPDGEAQPYVSTLNALDGAITSNMAIVPTNNGKIDAYASNPTNLILDLSSYFAP